MGSIIFHQNDMEDHMKEFLKVMKAASDPSRVKILKILQKKVMCVCEIQTVLGTAQSTASKHLKILEEAGLVTSHKDGLWVNYRLTDGHQSPYAANLIGNMRHWLDDEPEIAEILQSLPQIDRHEIIGKN
jgi:ArsR family transcriptional regulator